MGSVNITPKNKLLISVKVESGARGPQGPIGVTPQLTVVDTITGAPNTSANVVLSGTAENPGLTFTIPRGTPFDIAAKYESIADLVSNINPNPEEYQPTLFDLAIIQSNVEDEDNARLYIFDDNDRVGKGGWTFISDLSGATGPRRNLRWKVVNGETTSILEWENEDGSYNETDARDLALKFEFKIVNDELLLEIENPDGVTDIINLTATAEFGNGTNATVTSVKFNNNNGNSTNFQELGVYASFEGTELKLVNPNEAEVSQELGLSFDWDNTQLGVKTPTDQDFTYQKLSPDLSSDINGAIFIGEPGQTENLLKLSPNIAFQNVGNGLEISIVEPEDTSLFRKISPDITWDGTQLAITEPNTSPVSGDYVELGLTSEFGAGLTTDTTLTITNPQTGSIPISQELGVYGEFGEGTTTITSLTLTNPDSTTIVQELGLYANFDETNVTKLIITNPDNQTVEQELGVYANFEDITKLVLTNPDDSTIEQQLGLYGNFNSEQSITTLVITNPDTQTIEQELGVYAEWGTILEGTNRTLTLTNPDNQTISRDLGISFDWDGTQLGIKTADDLDFTYVDLKGETGDPAVAGTPLFKIRDQVDAINQGLQITVADEIQFVGGSGVDFIRNDKIYTVSITDIDGGGF